MKKELKFHNKPETARLIPVLPESDREKMTLSVLLAGLRSVYELRQAILGSVDQRVGITATLDAYTEVTFQPAKKKHLKDKKKEKDSRPDGLLILKTGRREWRALIEAKVGKEKVGENQLERYIEKAVENDIDAVITVTNQLTAIPSHHPVKPKGSGKKNVTIYHWSWSFLHTQCQLLLANDEVEDSDQIFILNEISRYFEHSRSGITDFTQMNAEWSEIISKARNHPEGLNKNNDAVLNTLFAWHQEEKDLCLRLAHETDSLVSLRIRPIHRKDPLKRIDDDAKAFCDDKVLRSTIIVTNAAADILVEANLIKRTLYFSMRLDAPKDKKSTKARLNWLLNQFIDKKSITDKDYMKTLDGFDVIAIRRGKAKSTSESVVNLIDSPELIESELGNTTATAFEVRYKRDLAGKFSGNQVFIRELEQSLSHFYSVAGQHLKAWVAPAPKVKTKSEPSDLTPDHE